MSDSPYQAYLAVLERAMRQARALGLYRTTEKVHAALNEARSEMYEATPEAPPENPVTVEFNIGPVSEQPQR